MDVTTLTVVAALLVLCVLSSKLLYRFGVPTLLIFLALGMLCGSDGPGGVTFDNYDFARELCSAGLIFIMFYGGFGTSWRAAKPVALPAVLLSSAGVVVTAVLTGAFCTIFLHVPILEGLLIGSVLGSTDAASVFSILRARRLNLRGGLASLLEIESGSNDPIAYMMTLAVLALMQGSGGAGGIAVVLVRQVALGLAVGAVVGKGVAWCLRRFRIDIDGLYSLLIMAVAILAYTIAETLGGNGYLSVYLAGLLLGNSRMLHKRNLVHFFDGVSWLAQIVLFFAIGLLSFPSRFPEIIIPGVAVFLFMLLVARPISVEVILRWFHVPLKSRVFVSWVGLRGAASIVFAIFAVSEGVPLSYDIFHIVFMVALLSVAVQGSLLPPVANALGLIDHTSETQVLRTFTDYEEECGGQLLEIVVPPGSPWADESIMDADIPEDILVVLIRRGAESIVPRGSTVLRTGDVLMLSADDLETARRALEPAAPE